MRRFSIIVTLVLLSFSPTEALVDWDWECDNGSGRTDLQFIDLTSCRDDADSQKCKTMGAGMCRDNTDADNKRGKCESLASGECRGPQGICQTVSVQECRDGTDSSCTNLLTEATLCRATPLCTTMTKDICKDSTPATYGACMPGMSTDPVRCKDVGSNGICVTLDPDTHCKLSTDGACTVIFPAKDYCADSTSYHECKAMSTTICRLGTPSSIGVCSSDPLPTTDCINSLDLKCTTINTNSDCRDPTTGLCRNVYTDTLLDMCLTTTGTCEEMGDDVCRDGGASDKATCERAIKISGKCRDTSNDHACHTIDPDIECRSNTDGTCKSTVTDKTLCRDDTTPAANKYACDDVTDSAPEVCRDNTDVSGKRGLCVYTQLTKGLCKDASTKNSCYTQNHIKCVDRTTGKCVDVGSDECRDQTPATLGACVTISPAATCAGPDGNCQDLTAVGPADEYCLEPSSTTQCVKVTDNICKTTAKQCLHTDLNACVDGSSVCQLIPADQCSLAGTGVCTAISSSICMVNTQICKVLAGDVCRSTDLPLTNGCMDATSDSVCKATDAGVDCHTIPVQSECKKATGNEVCLDLSSNDYCLTTDGGTLCEDTSATKCRYTDKTCQDPTDPDICLTTGGAKTCMIRVSTQFKLETVKTCISVNDPGYCRITPTTGTECRVVEGDYCRDESTGDCMDITTAYTHCRDTTKYCKACTGGWGVNRDTKACIYTEQSDICKDQDDDLWRSLVSGSGDPLDDECKEKTTSYCIVKRNVEPKQGKIACFTSGDTYCEEMGADNCRDYDGQCYPVLDYTNTKALKSVTEYSCNEITQYSSCKDLKGFSRSLLSADSGSEAYCIHSTDINKCQEVGEHCNSHCDGDCELMDNSMCKEACAEAKVTCLAACDPDDGDTTDEDACDTALTTCESACTDYSKCSTGADITGILCENCYTVYYGPCYADCTTDACKDACITATNLTDCLTAASAPAVCIPCEKCYADHYQSCYDGCSTVTCKDTCFDDATLKSCLADPNGDATTEGCSCNFVYEKAFPLCSTQQCKDLANDRRATCFASPTVESCDTVFTYCESLCSTAACRDSCASDKETCQGSCRVETSFLTCGTTCKTDYACTTATYRKYCKETVFCEDLTNVDYKCRDPTTSVCTSIESSFSYCKSTSNYECTAMPGSGTAQCLVPMHSYDKLCHSKLSTECYYGGQCFFKETNPDYCDNGGTCEKTSRSKCTMESSYACAPLGSSAQNCIDPATGDKRLCKTYNGATLCRHYLTDICYDHTTDYTLCVKDAPGSGYKVCYDLAGGYCRTSAADSACISNSITQCTDTADNNVCKTMASGTDCKIDNGKCYLRADPEVCEFADKDCHHLPTTLAQYAKTTGTDVCISLVSGNCVDPASGESIAIATNCVDADTGYCRDASSDDNYCSVAGSSPAECKTVDPKLMCKDSTTKNCHFYTTDENMCNSAPGGTNACQSMSDSATECRLNDDGTCKNPATVGATTYCLTASWVCQEIGTKYCRESSGLTCTYLLITEEKCRDTTNNNMCLDVNPLTGRSITTATYGECIFDINNWCERSGTVDNMAPTECRNSTDDSCVDMTGSTTLCSHYDSTCQDVVALDYTYCVDGAYRCHEMSTSAASAYCMTIAAGNPCVALAHAPPAYQCKDPADNHVCKAVDSTNCYDTDNICQLLNQGDGATGSYCKHASTQQCIEVKLGYCAAATTRICTLVARTRCIDANLECATINTGTQCREETTMKCYTLSGGAGHTCTTLVNYSPMCTETINTGIYERCQDTTTNLCRDISYDIAYCNDQTDKGNCKAVADHAVCRLVTDNTCQPAADYSKDPTTGLCIDYSSTHCYDSSATPTYIYYAAKTHCMTSGKACTATADAQCRDSANYECKSTSTVLCRDSATTSCVSVDPTNDKNCWLDKAPYSHACQTMLGYPYCAAGDNKCTALSSTECRDGTDSSCVTISGTKCQQSSGECGDTPNMPNYCREGTLCKSYGVTYCDDESTPGVCKAIANQYCKSSTGTPTCVDLSSDTTKCRDPVTGNCVNTNSVDGYCQLSGSKLCKLSSVAQQACITGEHEHWLLLEGKEKQLYGFISGDARQEASETICPAIDGQEKILWIKESIQIGQFPAATSTPVEPRAFTLMYGDMDWTFTRKAGYIAQNTYPGCHVYLMYNDPADYSKAKLQRATYTIQSHLDFLGVSRFEYALSGRRVVQLHTVTDAATYRSMGMPCGRGLSKYWYNPYTSHYFHLSAAATIILMDWGETEGVGACDTAFKSVDPVVHTIDLLDGVAFPQFVDLDVAAGTTTIKYIIDKFVFVREHAYFVIVDTDGKYRIVKWTYNRGNIELPHTIQIVYTVGTNALTSFVAFKNFGLLYTESGVTGYHMLELKGKPNYNLQEIGDIVQRAPGGNPLTYDPAVAAGANWKLFQNRINEEKQATIYGVNDKTAAEKAKVYVITNTVEEKYPGQSTRTIPAEEKARPDFYSNPTDFGSYYVLTLEKGRGCVNSGDTADADKYSAIFIDFIDSEFPRTCISEIPIGKKGNGFLDAGEDCDDGDSVKAGDVWNGCNGRAEVVLNYEAFNHLTRSTLPNYQSIGFLKKNKCGNTYHNDESPYFETCDDHAELDYFPENTVGEQFGAFDGCFADCKNTVSGYHPGSPGGGLIKGKKYSEKLCGNGVIDKREATNALYASDYTEELCDEGVHMLEAIDGEMKGSDRCVGCYWIHPEYECLVPGEKCVPKCPNGNHNSQIAEDGIEYYPDETCDEGTDTSILFYTNTDHTWARPSPSTVEMLQQGGCDKCIAKPANWACLVYGEHCVYLPLCNNNDTEAAEQCDYILKDIDTRCNQQSCMFNYLHTCVTMWYSGGTNCYTAPYPCCKSYYNNYWPAGLENYWTYNSPQFDFYRDSSKHWVCFWGKIYCWDCYKIKWPGYPLKNPYRTMLATEHAYEFIPDKSSRGRLWGLEYTRVDSSTGAESIGKLGFSVITVYKSYQWSNVINDQLGGTYNYINYDDDTDNDDTHHYGPLRTTFGKYFFIYIHDRISGHPAIRCQSIETPDDGVTYTNEKRFETTQQYPSMHANEFYIYWANQSFFLSRQYDGKYWQLFKFNKDTTGLADEATMVTNFQSAITYNVDIEGHLDFYPVFREEFMYLYREITDFAGTRTCQISKYKYLGLGSILNLQDFPVVCDSLISMVAMRDLIIYNVRETYTASHRTFNPTFTTIGGATHHIYKITSDDTVVPIIKGEMHKADPAGVVQDSTMTAGDLEGWIFMQGRPSPEFIEPGPVRAMKPGNSTCVNCLYNMGIVYQVPPGIGFTEKEIMNYDPADPPVEDTLHFLFVAELPEAPRMSASFDKEDDSKKWGKISEYNGVDYPNQSGRFALDSDAPWDVTRNLFMALGTHTCKGRAFYDWEDVEDISLNIFNFITKTWSCQDFELTDEVLRNGLLDTDHWVGGTKIDDTESDIRGPASALTKVGCPQGT